MHHYQPRATEQRRTWGINTHVCSLPLVLPLMVLPCWDFPLARPVGSQRVREPCRKSPFHRAGWRTLESGSRGANKISYSHIATFSFLNTDLRDSFCISRVHHPLLLWLPYLLSSGNYQLRLWHQFLLAEVTPYCVQPLGGPSSLPVPCLPQVFCQLR